MGFMVCCLPLGFLFDCLLLVCIDCGLLLSIVRVCVGVYGLLLLLICFVE